MTSVTPLRKVYKPQIDLLLELPNKRLWVNEIKRGVNPKLKRGFHHAREDLNPERCFVVNSGNERYPKTAGVEAIGLSDLCRTVSHAQPAYWNHLRLAKERQQENVEGSGYCGESRDSRDSRMTRAAQRAASATAGSASPARSSATVSSEASSELPIA